MSFWRQNNVRRIITTERTRRIAYLQGNMEFLSRTVVSMVLNTCYRVKNLTFSYRIFLKFQKVPPVLKVSGR
jgi:hypothetical protein